MLKTLEKKPQNPPGHSLSKVARRPPQHGQPRSTPANPGQPGTPRAGVGGVSISAGSNVSSNDLVSAIQYPDKTTGNPSSSSQESFTVNALGQNLTYTDRNGNVHSYSYDVLGRITADAVTTLGSGVDGSVRRIETAYDTGDRPYLFTSYNAASGGSIVNQVQDAFNGLGQLTEEWQSHSGAVNTSTTPNVQYGYALMAGGVNNSRMTSMTYPNGRVLNFNYAAGVDNTISRLTSISDSTGTLESESYLGLDTVVIRSQPQPGTELTYVKLTGEPNGDAGDQYTGLDRFGRVVDQRWIITSTGTATVRTQYGYDRDSNVLYSNNLVNSNFSELYHANGAGNDYDNLNQLTNFARGVLNSSNDTISSPTHSQSWGFDALGNWTTFTSDSTTQTRNHNQQNEITSISGLTTPTYDANGNMTGDQSGKTLIFDAWNRLVQFKNGSSVLETYGYDGLGRRLTENPGTLRDLFYSALWQVLEEDAAGSMQDQYVWSPVYVDALIERDTPTQRMYAQQDAAFNVTTLVDTSGNVQERYIYDPFGAPTVLAPNWTTRSSSSYGWIYLHEGGRYDTATGLYGFRHRDLSPTLGRWVELDPLGFGAGDSNFYRDVANSPIGGQDPSGLDGGFGVFPSDPLFELQNGRRPPGLSAPPPGIQAVFGNQVHPGYYKPPSDYGPVELQTEGEAFNEALIEGEDNVLEGFCQAAQETGLIIANSAEGWLVLGSFGYYHPHAPSSGLLQAMQQDQVGTYFLNGATNIPKPFALTPMAWGGEPWGGVTPAQAQQAGGGNLFGAYTMVAGQAVGSVLRPGPKPTTVTVAENIPTRPGGFGQYVHETNLQPYLEANYPGLDFQMNVEPGLTGPDAFVTNPDAPFQAVELKPNSPSGLQTFDCQCQNWAALYPDINNILFLLYDEEGNIAAFGVLPIR